MAVVAEWNKLFIMSSVYCFNRFSAEITAALVLNAALMANKDPLQGGLNIYWMTSASSSSCCLCLKRVNYLLTEHVADMLIWSLSPPLVSRGGCSRQTGNVCRGDEPPLDVGDTTCETPPRLIADAKQLWRLWREGFGAPGTSPFTPNSCSANICKDPLLNSNVILRHCGYRLKFHYCQNVTTRTQ